MRQMDRLSRFEAQQHQDSDSGPLEGSKGYGRGMVVMLLDNLQVTIRNVHLR